MKETIILVPMSYKFAWECGIYELVFFKMTPNLASYLVFLFFSTDNDSAIRFLLSISQVIMSISNLSTSIPRPRPPTEERERKHTLRSAPVHSPNFLIPKHGDGICSLCNKANLTNELRDISE